MANVIDPEKDVEELKELGPQKPEGYIKKEAPELVLLKVKLPEPNCELGVKLVTHNVWLEPVAPNAIEGMDGVTPEYADA